MCHISDLHTQTFENRVLDGPFSRQKLHLNAGTQNWFHALNSDSLLNIIKGIELLFHMGEKKTQQQQQQ